MKGKPRTFSTTHPYSLGSVFLPLRAPEVPDDLANRRHTTRTRYYFGVPQALLRPPGSPRRSTVGTQNHAVRRWSDLSTLDGHPYGRRYGWTGGRFGFRHYTLLLTSEDRADVSRAGVPSTKGSEVSPETVTTHLPKQHGLTWCLCLVWSGLSSLSRGTSGNRLSDRRVDGLGQEE